MLSRLNEGEKRLLEDASRDDVSFYWVLDHLFLYEGSVPSAKIVDEALAVVERLVGFGLVRLGTIEATGEMRSVGRKNRQVSLVRFVDEDPEVVLARVHQACRVERTFGDESDWRNSAWVVATERGREVAVQIREELNLIQIRVGDLRQRGSGNLDGRFEIVTPDGTFPADGWTDFVLPLLPMIAGRIESAIRGTPGIVHFMAGPFAMRFASHGRDLHVEVHEARPAMSPRIVHDSSRTAVLWVYAVMRACSKAEAELRTAGLASDSEPVRSLMSAEARLEGLVRYLSDLPAAPSN